MWTDLGAPVPPETIVPKKEQQKPIFIAIDRFETTVLNRI